MDKELRKLERRQKKVARKLAKFELKVAKEAYKKGLNGYICLLDGQVYVAYTYRAFKRMYRHFNKTLEIDEIHYKEMFV